jgi:hypothetical protein
MLEYKKRLGFNISRQIVRLTPDYALFQSQSAPRGCTEDEGGPLEAGLQEQASNHLKLRW